MDVAAIAGTDAAVDLGAAAGTGALTGAFNPGTDIADVFTFGLASAVGAAVGAGVGAGVGAAISSANKPKSPQPGISVLPSNDVSSALKKLQKEPTKNAALINMIESAQISGSSHFQSDYRRQEDASSSTAVPGESRKGHCSGQGKSQRLQGPIAVHPASHGAQ